MSASGKKLRQAFLYIGWGKWAFLESISKAAK